MKVLVFDASLDLALDFFLNYQVLLDSCHDHPLMIWNHDGGCHKLLSNKKLVTYQIMKFYIWNKSKRRDNYLSFTPNLTFIFKLQQLNCS